MWIVANWWLKRTQRIHRFWALRLALILNWTIRSAMPQCRGYCNNPQTAYIGLYALLSKTNRDDFWNVSVISESCTIIAQLGLFTNHSVSVVRNVCKGVDGDICLIIAVCPWFELQGSTCYLHRLWIRKHMTHDTFPANGYALFLFQ